MKPAIMKMEAKKEEIKAMLLARKSDAKIAKAIGVSTPSIRKYILYLIEIGEVSKDEIDSIREANTSRMKIKAKEKEIREMIDDGIIDKIIAERVGVSLSSIWLFRQKLIEKR